MSEDKTIKNFTASDIERYWQGNMPAAEMHALEKAAAEDPFLADALEGYQNTANSANDLSYLKKQLSKRTGGQGKIVKLPGKPGWWKAAALIIGLAGIGYAAVLLLPMNKENELANTSATQKNQEKDSGPAGIDTVTEIATVADNGMKDKKNLTPEKKAAENRPEPAAEQKDTLSKNAEADDYLYKPHQEKSEELQSAPAASKNIHDTVTAEKAIAKTENPEEKKDNPGRQSEKEGYKPGILSEEVVSRNRANSGKKIKPLNFSGIVLDNNNNAVPYANIINLGNQTSVLAGHNGYFTIPVEQDSLLLLDVRSQGYLSREFRLNRFDTRNNKLILYPADRENEEPGEITADAELYDPLLLKNEKIEFPEPEHGWPLLRQYMANNLTKNKESLTAGTVILSFSVNKIGRPVQIQVVKSLTKECDNEAIRLLKEGPRWIVKGKSNEVKIAVHFR